MKRSILKTLIIFVSSIALGIGLLCLAYLLPVKYMEANVKESIGIFEKQRDYYYLIPNIKSTKLDNFTDALMIQNAIYNGNEFLLDKVVNVYHYNLKYNYYESSVDSLIGVAYGKINDMTKVSYARYWHGYLILLKPLLMLFNYSQIKLINVFLQLVMLGDIILGFMRNNQKNVLFAYILSIICIYPFVIGVSLQFSTMFYIFNLGVLFILKKNTFLNRDNNYLYFFMILGIITSYFDFLTYPLTSYAMPMLVYLILNYNKKFLKNLKLIIFSGIFWMIGYVGMWASKWCIGSLFLSDNFISSAVSHVLFRASGPATNYSSRFYVIIDNFSYFWFLFVISFMILFIYIIINVMRNRLRFDRRNIVKYLPVLFLSVLPIMWYIVTGNHSSIHSWFTYRNLIVLSFSLFSYVLLLFQKENDGKLEE